MSDMDESSPTENSKDNIACHPKKVMVAFASYTPVHGDEMRLCIGDVVSIFQTYDDGWAFAVNQSTKSMGFVPRNFLQLYNGNTSSVTKNKSSVPPNRVVSMLVDNPKEAAKNYGVDYDSSCSNPANMHPANSPQANKDNFTYKRYNQEENTEGRFIPDVNRSARIPTSSEAQNRLKEIEISRKLRARPVTSFGKFRIQVIGDCGVGKTTLIKQLLNSGEILIADSPSFINVKGGKSFQVPLVEYKASTLHPVSVYPEEDRFNINIIDTPGYASCVDASEIMSAISHYCEEQFESTTSLFSPNISSTQLFRFLSGANGAHNHVDVCLYCILHRVTKCDIEYMRLISEFATVVPLFIKSDTMSREEAFQAKKDLVRILDEENINFFRFGLTPEEMIVLANSKVEGAPPLVVSSRLEVYKSSPKTSLSPDQDNQTQRMEHEYSNNDCRYHSPTYDNSARSNHIGSPIQPLDLEPNHGPVPDDYKPTSGCLNELRTLKLALLHYHADDIRRSTSLKYLFWRKRKC